MSADLGSRTLLAIDYIVKSVGAVRLAWVGLLMIASSLTEGIGLLLLVPITGIISGEPSLGAAARLFAPIADWPVSLLLGAVVVLVSFRAYIVYLVLDARTRLGLTLTRTIRVSLQRAILAAEWRWLSRQNSATHAARLVGEAERVGGLGEEALSIATGAITALILMAAACAISWQLTGIALLTAGLVASCGILLRSRRNARGDLYGEAHEALQKQVSNGLFHLRAARIGGAEASLAEQFRTAAKAVEEAELRLSHSHSLAHVLFQAIAAVSLGFLVYLALSQFKTPLSVLVPVLAIMVRLVPVATNTQQGVRRWTSNRAALDTLQQLIADADENREQRKVGLTKPDLRAQIELRGIRLCYEGRDKPVFDNLNLTIAAGSVVCVVGPSGTGKSSLADILGGLISPDAGQVLIDGEVISGALRANWRSRVAYVEQIPYLFDGTIAENLCWGLPVQTENALLNALELASATFVHTLPLGLATRVGEQGRQFSGGERQRLALARALLRQPDLLILDEVTSALDGGNELGVIETIAALKGRYTVLILGHRTSFLSLADQVIDLGDDACASGI